MVKKQYGADRKKAKKQYGADRKKEVLKPLQKRHKKNQNVVNQQRPMVLLFNVKGYY